MDNFDCCSPDHVHWSEPCEGPRAVVDDLGDGGLHALPSHHRTPPRDSWLHQRTQADEYVLVVTHFCSKSSKYNTA